MKFCAFFLWNSKISQFTTKLIQNNANKQMNREIGERKKKKEESIFNRTGVDF